jgi:tetratricopeptide (TPR) repeat protein
MVGGRWVSTTGLLAGLLLAWLLLGTARAQDRKAEARTLTDRGSALFERGDYAGAIRAFSRAYALVPHYLTQCNIARCHEMRGEHALAARHYRRCIDEGGRGTPAEGPARKGLAAAERKARPREERARVTPARREEPARVAPARREEPARRARPAGKAAPHPFFAALTLGPAVELEALPTQVKLDLVFGYHFFRVAAGPALAFDLQLGVAGGFVTVELGPRFLWDIPVAPAHGFSIAPSLMFGYAHITERCPRGLVCFLPRDGLTVQIACEARLLIAERLLLIFTPFQIDILPSEARDDWQTAVRYDLLFGFGAAF